MLDLMESDFMKKPDSDLMKESLATEIDRALSALNKREADVIRLYYGLNGVNPFTLEEIGSKFGLTRERVRQIKEKSIRKLKQNMRKKLLQEYLD